MIAVVGAMATQELGSVYVFPDPYRSTWEDVSPMLPFQFLSKATTIALGVLILAVLLSIILRIRGSEQLATQGATRIIYFATVLQPFIEMPWSVIMNKRAVDCWGPTIHSIAVWAFTVAVVVKLAIVFRGTTREPRMPIALALVAALMCPDAVWCVLVHL